MSAAAKFYSVRPMDFATATADTEATGHAIEKAVDNNLDTHWAASSTATEEVAFDLGNDMQERIPTAADRELTSEVNWANIDLNGFTFSAGELQLVGTTADLSCELETAGLEDFQNGETYRITYTCTIAAGAMRFQCGTTDQIIGAWVAGTDQTIDFTCTGDSATLVVMTTASSTSVALQDISIRRITDGDTYLVNAFAVFLKNSNTYFGATAAVKLEYSDDDTNWIEFADKLLESEMTNTSPEPLRIYVNSTAQARRYWRFTFTGMAVVAEVAGLFLLTEYDPTVNSKWPEADKSTHGVTRRRLAGQRLAVEPGSRTPVQRFDRLYALYGTTPLAVFRAMYAACLGGATPIIFNEGADYYVARITTPTLEPMEVEYQVFDLALRIETLPYIADGDVQ